MKSLVYSLLITVMIFSIASCTSLHHRNLQKRKKKSCDCPDFGVNFGKSPGTNLGLKENLDCFNLFFI